MAQGLLEMFSLVEWVIFSFIGANMTLASVYIVQQSIRRLTSAAGE